MKERIDTLCSYCCGHAEIEPHESYLPLCKDCKERLFGAPRDNSADGLRNEMALLQQMKKYSLLMTAFLLYDNWKLQQLLPPGSERKKLAKEAENLHSYIGRSVLPGLFHQLALYFFHAGRHEDAISLLQNATDGLFSGYLLHGQSEGHCQHHLSECYLLLAKIYESLGDCARQVWALNQAELHLRAQISFAMERYSAAQADLYRYTTAAT